MSIRLIILSLVTVIAIPIMVNAQTNSTAVPPLTEDQIDALYLRAETFRKIEDSADDLNRAVEIYERLVEIGHSKSLVKLAKIYLQDGRGGEALQLFQTAADQGSSLAKYELGRGHLKGSFGAQSDSETGQALLQELADGGSDSAAYALADALRTGRGVRMDATRAFDLFSELAARNDVRASHRLGDMYRSGTGTEKNLEAAIAAYEAAAAGGYNYSLIRLSSSYSEASKPAKAVDALERAVALEVNGSRYLLANGHCSGKFESESDPAFGCAELGFLAEEGHTGAGAKVLKLHEKRATRVKSMDLQLVLGQMTAAMENGDQGATEALARFYRKLDWLIPNARQIHIDLVGKYGEQLRPKRQLPEKLHALYNGDKTKSSWPKLATMLSEAPSESFYYGFMELRSIDKNAFVYELQTELLDAGFYNGRLTGKGDTKTLNAIKAFCAAIDAQDTCKHGPLSYSSSSYVGRALQRKR